MNAYQSTTDDNLRNVRHTGLERAQKVQDDCHALVRHKNVHSRGNVHAMAATAHGLLVSNTLCRTKPMMASCTMQRNAEVTSELPTPRLRVVEMSALKRIKARPRPTLTHVKLVGFAGGASMVRRESS